VAHDAVGDPEDARELLQRLRLGVEIEQVIGALGLVGDLVRKPAASPDVVPDPLAPGFLHQVARTLDDLLLPLFRQLGIEHEQDFVCNQRFPRPPFLWSESAPSASAVREETAR
jgi:hypothetical protein